MSKERTLVMVLMALALASPSFAVTTQQCFDEYADCLDVCHDHYVSEATWCALAHPWDQEAYDACMIQAEEEEAVCAAICEMELNDCLGSVE